jgi:hypothetical protein
MISATKLTDVPVLDNDVYLNDVEARKVADWINNWFGNALMSDDADGDDVVPSYAVGMSLCSETIFLDTRRELTSTEIDRVLDLIRWSDET